MQRKRLWYPNIENIIQNNKTVLGIHKASKKDSHKVTGDYNLPPAIKEAKRAKGDIEFKAAVLMRGINQAHSFGSANKRTAYFTANQFIAKNRGYWIAKKRDNQRDMMIKIREKRVSDKDVADWLRKPNKKKKYGSERF
jgi:death-on-curing family protein